MESAVLIVAEDPRQSSPQIADVLCNHDAVLPEKTADLIDEPDAIGDHATTNPMDGLHRQLFGGLDGHEAHVRSLSGHCGWRTGTSQLAGSTLAGIVSGRTEERVAAFIALLV